MDYEDIRGLSLQELELELNGRKRENKLIVDSITDAINDSIEAFNDFGYEVPKKLSDISKFKFDFKNYDHEKSGNLTEEGISQFAHDLIKVRNVLESSSGDINKYEEGLESVIEYFNGKDDNPFVGLDDDEKYQLASKYLKSMGEMSKRYSNVKFYDSSSVVEMVKEAVRLNIDSSLFQENFKIYEIFEEEIKKLDPFDENAKVDLAKVLAEANIPSQEHIEEKIKDLRRHRKEFESFTRFNEIVRDIRKREKESRRKAAKASRSTKRKRK